MINLILLENLFDDPILIAIFSIVGIIISLVLGKYIAGWIYRIDEQIILLERIVELQKEQIKFFKEKFGEEKNEAVDEDFKKWLEEQKKE